MRAVLVSVDYADLLALTLPRNRHHFTEVMVVTTPTDTDTIGAAKLCRAKVFCTNAFYEDGADFNKWKALEEGLDAFGRWGWLCLMDADIVWPKSVPSESTLQIGNLYTPLCHIVQDYRQIPPESQWGQFHLRPNQKEWAGYSQIFHASDPHLGPPPWHQTDWKHAGGADSFFQRNWPPERKVRPGWKVLHLGPHGRNWCGRVTAYRDGTSPVDRDKRAEQLRRYMQQRRATRSYNHERIRSKQCE